ncbi:MAG: PD-(D/E)XK nuclease family protein [Solirubrobacteraceae bacterium]
MPLTLVTGPANAAKAGVVLGAYREALAATPEPLLVVPTSADVEPYQRELAAAGAVFGGEVLTFARLLGLIARRGDYRGRRLGFVARDRAVAAAVAAADLRILGASARTPGFARAAGRLFAELQRAMVSPERFTSAMRTWGAGPRAAYAADVAALYSAYGRRLEQLGRVDPEGFAWRALDALRADPAAWGGRPVFLYGFDDLTPAQLDAVQTLVGPCGAEVTLSLTYEADRPAFAARADTVDALRPLAQAVVTLPERDDHYGRAARPALHHLERHLFDGSATRQPPNGAVRLLEAGGERAEAELIGATLLQLVEEGAAPGDMAVLVRAGEQAPLLAQVLESYGLPVERAARVPLRETRLGAGLLAYGRAALGGSTADLLTWLRTPGKAAPEVVDALERRLRRAQVATAADAVAMLARDESPPGAVNAGLDLAPQLGELRAAAEEGAGALLDSLEAELDGIWAEPYRREAAVLDADGHTDARVAGELRHAARELRDLGELAGDARDVLAALGDVEVRLGSTAARGVLIADPLAVRARRFRVVVVCGLQDGVFPRRPTAEPFLDDADRRDLARRTGIVLPLHEDGLARERFLFYTAVSRAEEVLLLSFRASDEEGEPQLRSPFVDDVVDRFTEDLWSERGRRLLAEVVWPPAQAPTPLELRRAQAAAAPSRAEAGPLPAPGPDLFADHDRESARGLEAFAACGVRWLVERVLKPQRLDPDPEPMTRGSLAHKVLEQTLRGLRERTGSARLIPATRAAAGRELSAALAELGGSRAGAVARAGLRALEVELGRWLDRECEHGPGFEPRWLEWSFGRGDDPPLQLANVAVTGVVDRIDVGPHNTALVRDYKASKGFPQATWAADGHLQAALYALAARDLLGLELVGALYQPLKGADLRPRGAVVGASVSEGQGWWAAGLVGNDVVDAAAWEALLGELRAEAEDAAARMRAGEIHPCPERCSPRGCAYPGICRAPDAAPPPASA